MDSETKVALISDVTSNVGLTAALCLARNGVKVCIVGRDRQKVQDIEMQCNRISNVKCIGLVVDFQQDQLASSYVMRRIIEKCGKLDTLVLCSAPICHQTDCTDLSSLLRYKHIMHNNLDTPIELSLLAIQHLDHTGGNITFVSSINCCEPGIKSYAHKISMTGMRSFIKCLALDVAPRIRVNMISLRNKIIDQNFTIRRNSNQHRCNCNSDDFNLESNHKLNELAQTIYTLASDRTASLVNGIEVQL